MTVKQESVLARGIVYVFVVVGMLTALLVATVLNAGCTRTRVLRDGTILTDSITADEILRAVDGLLERSPEAAARYIELKEALLRAKLLELEVQQAELEARVEEEGGSAFETRLEYVMERIEAFTTMLEELNAAAERIDDGNRNS